MVGMYAWHSTDDEMSKMRAAFAAATGGVSLGYEVQHQTPPKASHALDGWCFPKYYDVVNW